jgi:hypothetical protein
VPCACATHNAALIITATATGSSLRMPRDSRDAALTGRAFARARVRDRAAAAGGKGQHADMIGVGQAGQLWVVLLSFGFCVRGSGYGVAVMQGA